MTRRRVEPAAVTPPAETLALSALVASDHNPRQAWKPDQIEPFTQSLRRFGDLGGIVRNLTTDRLVGGHKRVAVFQQSADVQITKVDQPEDAQGTVAHGYVIVEGNRFAYREVRWSADTESAANLAANRWGAEWNWELVSSTLQGISDPELLALTGFPAHELDNLLAAEWTPAPREPIAEGEAADTHAVTLTAVQYGSLQQVKARMTDTGETLTDAAVITRLCTAYLEGA